MNQKLSVQDVRTSGVRRDFLDEQLPFGDCLYLKTTLEYWLICLSALLWLIYRPLHGWVSSVSSMAYSGYSLHGLPIQTLVDFATRCNARQTCEVWMTIRSFMRAHPASILPRRPGIIVSGSNSFIPLVTTEPNLLSQILCVCWRVNELLYLRKCSRMPRKWKSTSCDSSVLYHHLLIPSSWSRQ